MHRSYFLANFQSGKIVIRVSSDVSNNFEVIVLNKAFIASNEKSLNIFPYNKFKMGRSKTKIRCAPSNLQSLRNILILHVYLNLNVDITLYIRHALKILILLPNVKPQ